MRWHIRTAALATVALGLTGGCASRRIKQENALALAAADARVLQGCYDCLLEARAIYERLGGSKYMMPDTIRLRSFETLLLLALREKELQLDWTRSLERAREIAPTTPPVDAERLLVIVDAVLPNGIGRMSAWPEAMRRARAGVRQQVQRHLHWLASTPLRAAVRDYIALALDCSYDAQVLAPKAQPGTKDRRPVLPPDAPPIITYRTGICMVPDTNMLAAVMAVVPEFHEAAFFAGSVAALRAEEDGGTHAAKLLDQAYRRFRGAPPVSYVTGWLAMNLGECSQALGYFEETIGTDSTHELALLNGTICLSRLRRDSMAIGWATRLIDLESSSTQPAHYWRAVSGLRLKDLSAARGDIERAKALQREPNALTMAGIIENDQDDLATAEKDLREAIALPRGDQNCTAAWTLGLVLAKQNRPGDAASSLERAMDCFDAKVAYARAAIARLRAQPPSNPAYAARRLTALEADSADQRSRYYAAAFNAAGNRANAGNLDRALELLEIADRDGRLGEPIAKLRQAIAAASTRARR